jgi:exodeoxyribonuclease-5
VILSPQQDVALLRIKKWLGDKRRKPFFYLAGYAGTGKALPTSCRVLTPHGYRTMGELSVGDSVIGGSGRQTAVLGVFPQGLRPTNRITFTDETSVECDDDHLWPIYTRSGVNKKICTMTTRQLAAAGLCFANGRKKYAVPLCGPVIFDAGLPLTVHPYVLGVILGDGDLSGGTIRIHKPERDVLERVLHFLPNGDEGHFAENPLTLSITKDRISYTARSQTKQCLEKLGVAGCAVEKKIPPHYLTAGVEDRLELLRGLLDTDGSVTGSGYEFSTVSPDLAQGVCFLARSLGAVVRSSTRRTSFTYLGEKKTGQLSWRIAIRFLDDTVPTTSEKHTQRRAHAGTPNKDKRIAAIEPIGERESLCIKVAAPDGLFLVEDFVVTHNTTCARYFAEHVVGNVLYAAYTGKAASVMSARGCTGASTIHSLIYIPKVKCRQDLKELEARLAQYSLGQLTLSRTEATELQAKIAQEKAQLARPSFALNLESELKHAALLVVDECSMASAAVGQDLESFGVPILALGDPAQLPPVRGEGYFTANEPDFLLTEIHRQAAESPIIQMATMVREGRELPLGRYGTSEVTCSVGPYEALMHDQIIVGRNETRNRYNQKVRALFGRTELLEIGDRVVCLRNNHDRGLMNGAVFSVGNVGYSKGEEEITGHGNYMEIFNEEGSAMRVSYHPDTLEAGKVPEGSSYFERQGAEEFCHAYALTGHKCVHPSTLVETAEGLLAISEIAEAGTIATHEGPRPYLNLVKYPERPMLVLTTRDGYQIIVTPDHKIEESLDGGTGSYMRMAGHAHVGMKVRLKLGATVEPPIVEDLGVRFLATPESQNSGHACLADFVTFLGLLFGHGGVWTGGGGFGVRDCDEMVSGLFARLCRQLFGITTEPFTDGGGSLHGTQCLDRELTKWVHEIAPPVAVPDCVMRSPSAVHRIFLNAATLGWRRGTPGTPTFQNLPAATLRVLQTMFLRAGLPTILQEQPSPVLRVPLSYLSNDREFRPATKAWHQTEIASIEMTRAPSMCVEVPSNHRFLQNGFPFSNSQGSQWNDVLVMDEGDAFGANANRWRYTCITRAAEKVTVVRK